MQVIGSSVRNRDRRPTEPLRPGLDVSVLVGSGIVGYATPAYADHEPVCRGLLNFRNAIALMPDGAIKDALLDYAYNQLVAHNCIAG